MNTCVFVGRLVADAKLDTTPAGKSVCKFRLASDTGWGEHKDTHWLNCSIWGERGTKVAPYLTRGTPVTVSGDLKPPRLYQTTQTGETRVAQDLTVQEIALQGRGSDEGGATPDQTPRAAQGGSQGASGASARDYAAASGAPRPSGGGAPFEDDIPFDVYQRGILA